MRSGLGQDIEKEVKAGVHSISDWMSGRCFQPGYEYAGFWRRLTAFLIDYVLLLIFMMLGLLAVDQVVFNGTLGQTQASLGEIIEFLGVLIFWLYFAGLESSAKQATLGKMLLGLRVVDLEGKRLGFWRATGRHFAKLVSALPLMLGFVMIAFSEQKRGVHDVLAKTYVIYHNNA